MYRLILIVAIGAVFVFSIFNFRSYRETATGTPTPSATSTNVLKPPLTNAMNRITKKPFGIYISPATSPVSPERFTGYHTGTDFETTTEEQNFEVPVYAICEGPLLQRRVASGYGGLAVQACTLDGRAVTVVYGHIKLSGMSVGVGQVVHVGDQLALLGAGGSTETDGERKHLHLGVHIGEAVNIAGYVQKQEQLSAWLNVASYLP